MESLMSIGTIFEPTPINKMVYILAVIFVLIFGSAQCVQIGSTVIKENDFGSTWLNAESYAYLCHAAFACIMPVLINSLGYRLCFLIGASGYFAQCVAPIFYERMEKQVWILTVFLMYKGSVASLIWCAYGAFKIPITDETNTGGTDGAFYTIYKATPFLTAGLLNFCKFYLELPYQEQVLVYAQVGALGVVSMLIFDCYDSSGSPKKRRVNIIKMITETLRCLVTGKSFRLLFVAFAISGMMRGWVLSSHMKYGGANSLMFMFPFGMSSMASSYIFGQLFDSIENKKILLYSACFMSLGALALACWSAKLRDEGHLTTDLCLCFLTQALAAAGISGVEVSLSAAYGILCPEKATFMFSAHQVVFGLGVFISKKVAGIKPSDVPDWLKIGMVEHDPKLNQLPLSLIGIGIATATVSVAILCIFLSEPLVAHPHRDDEKHDTLVEHRRFSVDVSSFTA